MTHVRNLCACLSEFWMSRFCSSTVLSFVTGVEEIGTLDHDYVMETTEVFIKSEEIQLPERVTKGIELETSGTIAAFSL